MASDLWLALLKGVNVGGHNKVKMADLKAALTTAGIGDVRTYIQSGNVLGRTEHAAEFAETLMRILDENFDIQTDAAILGADDVTRALANIPFDEPEPKKVHLYFSPHSVPPPAMDKLTAKATQGEGVAFIEDVLYLHTPNGMGTSKLPQQIVKMWPAPVTARNLNTMRKLQEMF